MKTIKLDSLSMTDRELSTYRESDVFAPLIIEKDGKDNLSALIIKDVFIGATLRLYKNPTAGEMDPHGGAKKKVATLAVQRMYRKIMEKLDIAEDTLVDIELSDEQFDFFHDTLSEAIDSGLFGIAAHVTAVMELLIDTKSAK